MLPVFTDPRCLRHAPGPGYPECPERLVRILDRLRRDGAAVTESATHEAARPSVEAVHDPRYVARFERSVERGDPLLDSADNPLTSATADAAWGAVEVALTAADHVVSAGGPAFAAVRPPGHHAEHATAMGFCYFNNVAAVARYLQARHGLDRVAIFDPDVHHGNGTQHIFEDDPTVFYASTHQFPFYPGTGAADETGVGAGEGATLNVPLPAATDDAGYEEAIRGRVLPALEAFAPDLLILSIGFDAWLRDPLGGMRVSLEGFESWGRWCGELADRVCGGRVLAALEGGYDLTALGSLASAFLTGLTGGAGVEPVDSGAV